MQQTLPTPIAINKCRVCSGQLSPLFTLKNMPAMAQNFPSKTELGNDKGEDLEVCQCLSCGLVQLSCEPVPYYKEVIRAAAYSEEMKSFRLEQFSGFVTTHKLHGQKILEVGSGKGEYLSLMQQQGVEAYGLEYAKDATTYARNIINDYIDRESLCITHSPFDAFFCLNFLEHMPDPAQSLRGIANNLTENAVGLIEVPNFDMIIEKNLFSEFIKDHLFYFTKNTLTNLLEQNGFDVLSCNAVWHDYSLSAVVRKKSTTDLTQLITFKVKVAESISSFIRQFPERQVAIWGAGHQALAIINLLELNHKIAYVVDSAPFKQGKYTPGSHLPIFAPTQLVEQPVNAVIVMAASYSDEVSKTLREQFPTVSRVAILRDYGLEEV